MNISELKKNIMRLVDHASVIAPSIVNFERDGTYGNVNDRELIWDSLTGWEMEAKSVLLQLSKINPNFYSDLYNEYLEIKEASKKFHSKSIAVHKIRQLLVGAYKLIESPLSHISFSDSENSQREHANKEIALDTQKLFVSVTDNQNKEKKNYWEYIKKDFDVSKRTFGKRVNFIDNKFIRQVIFRDIEHAYTLCKSGYYKPSVLLAGGVIEELLRQYLQFKNVKPQKDTFDEYIKACEQYGLLKSAIRQLSDSVRQFRNLVHIVKEKSPKYSISRATAWGAVSIIFTISNDF